MDDQEIASNTISIYRASRIFKTKAGWAIATREGLRGPFDSQPLALKELTAFKRRVNNTRAS